MDLMLIEEEVKTFVNDKCKTLSSSEKTKRIVKTLNLINEIYNKHDEELTVEDAYEILYKEVV